MSGDLGERMISGFRPSWLSLKSRRSNFARELKAVLCPDVRPWMLKLSSLGLLEKVSSAMRKWLVLTWSSLSSGRFWNMWGRMFGEDMFRRLSLGRYPIEQCVPEPVF